MQSITTITPRPKDQKDVYNAALDLYTLIRNHQIPHSEAILCLKALNTANAALMRSALSYEIPITDVKE